MKKRLIIEEADLADVERAFAAVAERVGEEQARRLAALSDNLYLLKTWLTRAESARYVGMSEEWLKGEEKAGRITPKRLGGVGGHGSPRYRKADLDALIESMDEAA